MLAALRELASVLARDPLTVDDVIAHLGGTVTHDYGANVVLAPRDPAFREASIVRGLDVATRQQSTAPAHVDLTPAELPTIETLAHAFGTYTEIPGEEKVPPQVIFYLDMPGQPYTVALIAEVKHGHAVRLTLRRDRR